MAFSFDGEINTKTIFCLIIITTTTTTITIIKLNFKVTHLKCQSSMRASNNGKQLTDKLTFIANYVKT